MPKFYLWGLWISTILALLIAALQVLSGHWVSFFLLWPGGPSLGIIFIRGLMALAIYHRIAGFAIGGLSILILLFAFFSRSSIWVRSFAIMGLVMTALAASGGILYITSSLMDRLSLGQMADAAIGVFGAYFIQLFFMNKTPRLPWQQAKAD
jgi:hypothetical protein